MAGASNYPFYYALLRTFDVVVGILPDRKRHSRARALKRGYRGEGGYPMGSVSCYIGYTILNKHAIGM
jgi:hypothetical protein